MYRDDLAATHARLEQLQRELSSASGQQFKDRQRIAQLVAQLTSAQQALARLGGMQQQQMVMMQQHHYMFPSRASTVLTLGILSLVVCAVMGPIAWAMGNEEMRRMDSGHTPSDQRSTVTAGRVCGIVSSCLLMFFGFMFLVVLGTAR
jgi:hypothetical protein